MRCEDLRIEVYTQGELPWDGGYDLYCPEELRRISLLSDKKSRRQYQAQRQKLHQFLRSEFQRRGFPHEYCHPKVPIALSWSQEGKPRLSGREFEFSISHSGDYFALTSSSQPVGVDIEIHKQRDFLKLSQRFFHPHETDYLGGLSQNHKDGWIHDLWAEFYRIWTLKEAWVKCKSSQLLRLIGESTLDFEVKPESHKQNRGFELYSRSRCELHKNHKFSNAQATFNSYEFQGSGFSLSVVYEIQILNLMMSDSSFKKSYARAGGKQIVPFKCHLASGWTPLYQLSGLQKKYQHLDVELWIKDDSQTHDKFGGNKIRKLEYLIGSVYEQLSTPKEDRVVEKGRFKILSGSSFQEMVTLGFSGSNHCVATSLIAQELSKECSVFLKDQHPASYVDENLKRHHQLGTRIWNDNDLETNKSFPSLEDLQDLVNDADDVLWVPPGGTHPHSHWAYVEGVFEFAWQWWLSLDSASQSPSQHRFPHWSDLQGVSVPQQPDFIYIACGTMGTVLGLMIGLRWLGWSTQVVAVQVVPDFLVSKAQLLKQLNKFNRVLKEAGWVELEWSEDQINLVSDQFGEGYALPTKESAQAVKDLKRGDNVKLEWTYTGKVIAALEADLQSRTARLTHSAQAIKSNHLAPSQGDKIVFWNTYGG